MSKTHFRLTFQEKKPFFCVNHIFDDSNTGGRQIFQKSRSHVKIPGTKILTQSKFHTEQPQIFGATIQKFSCPGDLSFKICAPWLHIQEISNSNSWLHLHRHYYLRRAFKPPMCYQYLPAAFVFGFQIPVRIKNIYLCILFTQWENMVVTSNMLEGIVRWCKSHSTVISVSQEHGQCELTF
jgi:hypothetical protein